jgi:hypothetical protein
MSVHPVRRSILLAASVLTAGALVALCTTATAVAGSAKAKRPVQRASSLAGAWSGQYGGAFSGTFTLHWQQTGANLTGTIVLSNPHGTYGITGSVHNGAIKFGAVDVGAKYTGTVSGKSMSGSYTSPQGGGSWSAHKTG